GDAPDIHVLPVGNAGNITAYWKGYKEYAADKKPCRATGGYAVPFLDVPGHPAQGPSIPYRRVNRQHTCTWGLCPSTSSSATSTR
ncbi:hypothetical protein ACWDPC_36185, partial [Streptomyces misionensis]